jgi:hypothetical protein
MGGLLLLHTTLKPDVLGPLNTSGGLVANAICIGIKLKNKQTAMRNFCFPSDDLPDSCSSGLIGCLCRGVFGQLRYFHVQSVHGTNQCHSKFVNY